MRYCIFILALLFACAEEDIVPRGDEMRHSPKDPANAENYIYVSESMPGFPGGAQGLLEFQRLNLKHPKTFPKGRVYVEFIMGADGSVHDAKIIRGLTPECDQYALEMVRQMPRWKPALSFKGEKVSVKMILPVKFAVLTSNNDS